MTVESLITQHIDTWTSAVKTKSTSGRGSSKKLELYGVKKLRELILELAVRGKLVPQDPSDEPASVLLERIAAEKAQLVKEKKIKKPKKLADISEEEKPFSLPNGWAWIRLNEYGEWGSGSTPKRSNSEYYGGSIPWFKSGELKADYISVSEETITDLALAETSVRYNNVGDVLVAMYGATIGKTAILSVRATTNQAVCACTPFIGLSNTYLLLLLKAYKSRLIGMGAGGAQPNISREKIINTVIALPSENEQHRIVAKVDELMALCDQLEQQTEASIEAHQLLVCTLLNTLTHSADANELMENWARISDHFDTLFTTEESIDQLKQTILQLAVMGKLVPQDPNDEPASVLLERIAEEKAQLIKEKKIKKQKALPPITDDEKPFDLPNGWGFAHMQDLCELITDGTHQTPKYTDTGRPFISAQCVKPFRFMPENCRYVSEEHYQAYIKNRNPEFRDILLSRVGAGIGEAAMIDTNLEFAIYVSTGLLKPHKSSVMSEYLVLWLNSPLGRGFSERNTLGKGVSQGNLNLSLIRAFVVSLPPLQEQRKIVIQVEKLSNLCNLLKERLQATQLTQLNLTDAIVEQAV
ncbi:restriction endonuclease subunit S [Photobacterium damselae subsp. damselae]|uniref:restriction endonuclease subunit S n=1 Tax=Photobacterium damselae TaxID=38293 RepID=UPI000A2FCA8F|nr:restriction endonuclease subunit S [Photobacterium damselae]ARR49356.1 restriction endonuclease subunit S [Photobacterium damselae subsp. damselae]QAY36096.1 restriction endonuclease subunit S [Photobacterium damselae subsp. damselae]